MIPNSKSNLIKYSLPKEINCHHAGTTLRFLTAIYLQLKKFRVFGRERMHQRPIKPLVDCIRKLGIEIRYLKNEVSHQLKFLEMKLLKEEN